MQKFIENLPKVELHIHIEGSLEPELMFQLAHRNKVKIPFKSPQEVREAYQFSNLQSFLDIYYQGADVLRTEQDFFDLTWAYFIKCAEDTVVHTELFFDPQTHTSRGIPFESVVNGISRAMKQAETEFGISSLLIMCFLRHLSEEDALNTLEEALKHKDKIAAVGLDSSEVGNPPEKFANAFSIARENGLFTVAHAGEEGPPTYIRTAMDLLKVRRIDHGVRCIEDPELMKVLVESRMPLTVCPLSNLKLKVVQNMSQHNILELLHNNLCVTINSDDPAYFGGYMNDNFKAVAETFSPSFEELAQFTFNAIEASFISADQKKRLTKQVKDYVASFL